MASWQDRIVLQNILVQLRRLTSLTAQLNVLPGGNGLLLNGDLLVEGDVESLNLPPYIGGIRATRLESQSPQIESSPFEDGYSYAILTIKYGTISLNGTDLLTNTPYYFENPSEVSGFEASTGYLIELFYFENAPILPPLPTETIQITTTTTTIGVGEETSDTISQNIEIPDGASSAEITLSNLIVQSGISVEGVIVAGETINETSPITLDELSSPIEISISIKNTSDETIEGDSLAMFSLSIAYSR